MLIIINNSRYVPFIHSYKKSDRVGHAYIPYANRGRQHKMNDKPRKHVLLFNLCNNVLAITLDSHISVGKKIGMKIINMGHITFSSSQGGIDVVQDLGSSPAST